MSNSQKTLVYLLTIYVGVVGHGETFCMFDLEILCALEPVHFLLS